MMPRKVASLFLVLVALFAAVPGGLAGCGAPTDAPSDSTDDALSGIDYEHFPTRAEIDSAMQEFQRDPAAERAQAPVPLNDFFGSRVQGAFSGGFKVELLKVNGRTEHPLAALHAEFPSGVDPLNINNRYKDVHLFKLADALGTKMNPFPETVKIPGENAILMRMWTDFRKMAQGVPADMPADQVKPEIARIVIWSYVTGNSDGMNNSGNSGFAKFRDASGREFWRAILVDGGGSFTNSYVQPWTANIAGTGPIVRETIPNDVIESLQQLPRGSDADLRTWAGLDPAADTQLSTAILMFRWRAQEVLGKYGVTWQ